ncbi:Carboxylesterase [Temnothorax longispinosus]|uniref:Carboxylesterase n=1 Tax=Temnothorax longispinosus TaxID=300112 RepID=A0A4S2JF84_9HYME|nr:Carboxylesterase [Temnothorax longispinosus]
MDNSRVEICVHEGKLIGIVEKGVYGDYYTAFRGIPYAKPPIGELRFKVQLICYDCFTGLFHKAISQSGVIRCPWAFTEQQLHSEKGFRLAEKLGKATADPKVAYEFLKTIDAKKLIETERKFLLTESERKQSSLIFTPSLDHESSNPFFPEDPETFMCREVKVPFLLGFTSCEGSVMIGSSFNGQISKEDLGTVNSDFKKTILPRCLSTLSKISITIEELKSLYFGDKAVSEETLMNYVDFISDEFVCRGIMEVVDIQTKLNNNDNKATYLYQFSYESETNPLRKIFKVQIPGIIINSFKTI